MKNHSRTIRYVESEEEELQMEIEHALSQTMEENLADFCDILTAAYAMSGVDVRTYPIKRIISYSNE